MMNNLKLIVKLMVPYCLLVQFAKRHNVIMPKVGSNAVMRLIYGILPACIAIINGQKKHTDRRTIKYWFPYGLMKKHVASHYGILISSSSDMTGWKILRLCMPFGLILWWDAEKLRIRNRHLVEIQTGVTKPVVPDFDLRTGNEALSHKVGPNIVLLQTIQKDIASLRSLIEKEIIAQKRMIDNLRQEQIRNFENLQLDQRSRLEIIETELLRLQCGDD